MDWLAAPKRARHDRRRDSTQPREMVKSGFVLHSGPNFAAPLPPHGPNRRR